MRVSLYAYGMVITQSFNGAGDTGLRRGSTSVCFALRDPACLRPCQRTRNRAWGIFLAITIAFSTLAVVSAWIFKQGKWKVRDCLITLEIYEPLRQVGKDIYCVDGEWEKTALKRRMTVVKLSSGGSGAS